MSSRRNTPGYQRCDKITVKTVPFTVRSLLDLIDVDGSTVTDDSVLVYDQTNDKFVFRKELNLDQLSVDNITVDGNSISSTDTDGSIILDPNGTGSVDVSSANIVNLADPTQDQDAATKSYVDSEVSSLDILVQGNNETSESLSLGTDDIEFKGGEGLNTSVSKDNSLVTVNFDIGQAVGTTDSVTFKSGTFTEDLTVQGNLTVEGTLTTIDTINLTVEDSLIKLGEGSISDDKSIGFYGIYSSDGGVTHTKTGLFRNHNDSEYYLFDNLDQTIDDNIIDPTAADLSSLNADIVRANTFVGVIDGGTF